jgi:hypothetical protein
MNTDRVEARTNGVAHPGDQSFTGIDPVEAEFNEFLEGALARQFERFGRELDARGWTPGGTASAPDVASVVPADPIRPKRELRTTIGVLRSSWLLKALAVPATAAAIVLLGWLARPSPAAVVAETKPLYERDDQRKIRFNQSAPPTPDPDKKYYAQKQRLLAAYNAYEQSWFADGPERVAFEREVATASSRFPDRAAPFKLRIFATLGRAELDWDALLGDNADLKEVSSTWASSEIEPLRALYQAVERDCEKAPVERLDDKLAYENNRAWAQIRLSMLETHEIEKRRLANLAEAGAYDVVSRAYRAPSDPKVFGADGKAMVSYIDTYVMAARIYVPHTEAEKARLLNRAEHVARIARADSFGTVPPGQQPMVQLSEKSRSGLQELAERLDKLVAQLIHDETRRAVVEPAYLADASMAR